MYLDRQSDAGEFLNREAFGVVYRWIIAMKLPVDAVRSSDITDLMRKHMETVDGVSYIQVSPTYLYESMWCFALLILLLLYRRHKKFQGEVFLMYLFGYGAGRAWIEGLRTDQLWIPGTENSGITGSCRNHCSCIICFDCI
mgnify:CR=1 FL=1